MDKQATSIPDEFEIVETSMSKEAVIHLAKAPRSGKYYRLIKMFDGWIEAGGDDIMEVTGGRMDSTQKNYCSKHINKVAKSMGRDDIVSYVAMDRLFIVKQDTDQTDSKEN